MTPSVASAPLLRILLVLACFASSLPHAPPTFHGDHGLFTSIFASFELEPLAGPEDGLGWTEGPAWLEGRSDEPLLVFSDTIRDALFALSPAPHANRSSARRLRKVVSGIGGGGGHRRRRQGSHEAGDHDQAEPGPNGVLVVPAEEIVQAFGHGAAVRGPALLLCRHGARDVARLDLDLDLDLGLGGGSGPEPGRLVPHPLVRGPEAGRRFNGPNDLARHGNLVYFTDPIYALLERSRFADLPYVDVKVKEEGAGATAVYALHLPTGTVQRVDASLSRPNGVAVAADGGAIIVSDCCQGSHLPECAQGQQRWVLLFFEKDGVSVTRRHVIEDHHPAGNRSAGCCDGFAVLSEETITAAVEHTNVGPLLVATCAGPALCLVDLQGQGAILARLDAPARLSNVFFAPDGFLYVTGEAGIWRLALQQTVATAVRGGRAQRWRAPPLVCEECAEATLSHGHGALSGSRGAQCRAQAPQADGDGGGDEDGDGQESRQGLS